MFILKGKDFTRMFKEIYFSWWDYSDGVANFTTGFLAHTKNLNELSELDSNIDIEDIQICLDDVSIDFSVVNSDNANLHLLCPAIGLEDVNQSFSEKGEDINIKFDLPIRHKTLKFTEFKNKFNLKGTKKDFVKNPPKGFGNSFIQGKGKRHYTLNKTLEENCEYIVYETDLGRYWISL